MNAPLVQDQASIRDPRAEGKPKPSSELAATTPAAEASSSAASTVPGSRESPSTATGAAGSASLSSHNLPVKKRKVADEPHQSHGAQDARKKEAANPTQLLDALVPLDLEVPQLLVPTLPSCRRRAASCLMSKLRCVGGLPVQSTGRPRSRLASLSRLFALALSLSFSLSLSISIYLSLSRARARALSLLA